MCFCKLKQKHLCFTHVAIITFTVHSMCLTAHKDGIYKQCPLQFSCTTAKSLDSGQS